MYTFSRGVLEVFSEKYSSSFPSLLSTETFLKSSYFNFTDVSVNLCKCWCSFIGRLFVCLFVCLCCVCLFVCLFISYNAYLSVCLFVCLSVGLLICLFVCLLSGQQLTYCKWKFYNYLRAGQCQAHRPVSIFCYVD